MRALRVTAVRREPDPAAERVTELQPSEPVRVVGTRDAWVEIRAGEQPTSLDEAGYPGWVLADALGDEPLAVARTLLGTPYLWGGVSPSGIDCSGLVHLAHRATGRRVPRDAADQAATAVPVQAPEPGDLYFFARYGEPVHHVGFVTATGMLHADPERGVVDEPLPEDRRATLVGAGRLP